MCYTSTIRTTAGYVLNFTHTVYATNANRGRLVRTYVPRVVRNKVLGGNSVFTLTRLFHPFFSFEGVQAGASGVGLLSAVKSRQVERVAPEANPRGCRNGED